MTLPTIVPAQYTGTYTDFLELKADREGAYRCSPLQASVPTGTAAGAIVGLVPFRKGARFVLAASSLNSDALGTGATITLGVVYNDNVNNTNNTTLFIATPSTVPAAGGNIPLAANATVAAEQWFSTGDGWIVATTGGTTTASTGNLHGQFTLTYDIAIM